MKRTLLSVATIILATIATANAQRLEIVAGQRAETSSAKHYLRGMTDPDARIEVNGRTFKVYPTGAFAAEVQLTEGDNKVTVKAVRPDGSTREESFDIRYTLPQKPQPVEGFAIERFTTVPARIEAVSVGDQIMNGSEAPIKAGNCLPLRNIPVGTTLHCIEILPGKGAQLARTAGAAVVLMAREGSYAQVRLRSGEVRRIHIECRATIGEVGNAEQNLRKLGKAGAMRWRGVRPTVRGVVMNPVDHPHGGGEGRTSGGRHPVTPWGQKTKGLKTRSNKRTTSMIVSRRNKK